MYSTYECILSFDSKYIGKYFVYDILCTYAIPHMLEVRNMMWQQAFHIGEGFILI